MWKILLNCKSLVREFASFICGTNLKMWTYSRFYQALYFNTIAHDALVNGFYETLSRAKKKEREILLMMIFATHIIYMTSLSTGKICRNCKKLFCNFVSFPPKIGHN